MKLQYINKDRCRRFSHIDEIKEDDLIVTFRGGRFNGLFRLVDKSHPRSMLLYIDHVAKDLIGSKYYFHNNIIPELDGSCYLYSMNNRETKIEKNYEI